jgi:hypothetical protein
MRAAQSGTRGDVYPMIEANGALKWSTNGTATYGASGDISNTNLYSNPVRLALSAGYSIQLVTTGATVTGAFKLQFSLSDPNSEDPDTGMPLNPPPASMTWTDLPNSSQTVTVLGDVGWIVADAFYPWVRVVWTETGTAVGGVTGRSYTKGAI